MLTLHLAANTIALAAHIALEEAGLPHRLAWLDFATAQQTGTDYARINPKARVPALETPDGTLTETPAILEHIARLALSAALMPTDPWAQARTRETMGWLAATVHVNHAHKMRGHRWTDDAAAKAALTAYVPKTMTDSAAQIETLLPQTDDLWLGTQYTVADIHLHAIARWLPGDGVDIAAFPRLVAHGETIAARPAVSRATALHT